MTGKPGHWLTPEQSLRMAMLDNVTREQAIAAIAGHLRAAGARAYHTRDAPANLYSMPMGVRSPDSRISR